MASSGTLPHSVMIHVLIKLIRSCIVVHKVKNNKENVFIVLTEIAYKFELQLFSILKLWIVMVNRANCDHSWLIVLEELLVVAHCERNLLNSRARSSSVGRLFVLSYHGLQ